MSEVVKTMTFAEARSILSSEIDKLRNGETTAANVNAICNAIGKFLGSVKLQLEIDRILGRKPQEMAKALDAAMASDEGAPPPDPKKPN